MSPTTHQVKVGDIWNSDWGYDETRISFYEVVRVTEASVWLQKIGSTVTDDHGSYRHKVPNKAVKVGEEFRRKLHKPSGSGYSNCCSDVTSFELAAPWDGKPQFDSSGSR